jgi:peptidoglycan/xylan/chitin deacetylase (PgdA/CDA1 family)
MAARPGRRRIAGGIAGALAAALLAMLPGSAAAPDPAGGFRWVDPRGTPAPLAARGSSDAHSPVASSSSTDPHLPAAVLARLPRFGPPPPAAPIPPVAGPRAQWLARIPTAQPVAFVTIDDGWTRLPEAPALVAAAHVPVTLFLTVNAIRADPGYFTRFRDTGARIEAHTITHQRLPGQPYGRQRHEICGSADQLGGWYGHRPYLFRAPFGDHEATTLGAAHDCGMRAVVFWRETVNNGVVRFQEGSTVRPGDIILMHFRPRFVDDFIAALQAIKDAGLTPALLEDYLPDRS